MKARQIKENIFWVGAVDWDRRLFDSLIPLPDGTSYNAYLIKDEKTVLVDTVEPVMVSFLFGRLRELNVEHLDYIVVNHAEQDHSGALGHVLSRFPTATVLCTDRGKDLLVDLLHVDPARIRIVDDGEKVSIGARTLEFVHVPWVHWPDTMATYVQEDRVLFSGDFFGSHLATSELFSEEDAAVRDAAKSYYAQVMMPFRTIIRRHLDKISKYQIDMIAPTHGPIHNIPSRIIEYHRDWVSDNLANKAVIIYVSMHGSTEVMADHLVDALIQRDICVEKYNLAVADIGKMAASLVDAATLVIGSPTVLAGAHPWVVSAAFLANALRPKLKFASIFGSYGWGGRMVEQITTNIPNLKVEMLPPVLTQGYPKDEDFAELDKLAEIIATKHRENNIA